MKYKKIHFLKKGPEIHISIFWPYYNYYYPIQLLGSPLIQASESSHTQLLTAAPAGPVTAAPGGPVTAVIVTAVAVDAATAAAVLAGKPLQLPGHSPEMVPALYK